MSSLDLDVLIIGAGPVGLTLACELRRYGLAVRIVDCAPAPTDKSKALAVWPRTLEHLDRAGIAQAFASNGIHATEGHFFQCEERISTVPLNAVETPFPYGLMIPQDQTERLLTEHLAALGLQVERSTTFHSLTDAGNHVTATLTKPDGSTETVTARWLAGCDGAHSAVRHAVGAQFIGKTLPSDWVLADFHQHDARRVTTVELHLHADGVLALFPIAPDRLRVIANTASGKNAPERDTPAPEPTVEQIQSLLDKRGGRGITIKDPLWLSGFHINERKVADYRHGNVFLAGDSAHVHSPAGGQGMNTGMQDAFNLAWKLALVRSGTLTAAANELLLASYNAERGPVAAQVLRGSGFLTRMGTLNNMLLRGLRNKALHLLTGLETVQQAFAREVTELAVAYPKTKLNSTDGTPDSGPKAGERAPLTAGSRPVSTGNTPVFTLFAPAGNDAEQLIACYPELFDPEVRPPFGEGGIWLVRPDGYVGFAGDSDSWPAADAYLGKLKWPQQTKA